MRTWPALEILFGDPSDLLAAHLTEYNVSAIHETSTHVWRVFFATAAARDAAAASLAAAPFNVSLRPLEVPDEDWAARSQASLRAVRVGRLVVAPPWDVPAAVRLTPGDVRLKPDTTYVVIQPSMGFGTGHHATTRLCLAALQEVELAGRHVLDVGTGSGVLAIAASRLGAAAVLGMDEDPDALQAAAENVALNEDATVALERGDLRDAARGTFDVVVANLTGALLIQAAGRLQDVVAAPGGVLILSGFMRSEEAGVRAAYAGFAPAGRTEEDEWVCVALRRT